MKNLEYQQRAVNELVDKTIRLLNIGGQRNKLVFEATTGAGKTVMACKMLASLMSELRNRGDSRYREVAFIWFAPRKLHIQSYEKLKYAFEETRTIRPIMFDELDQNEGIRPGEILFINWESVNKENNVMVREGDCSLSLYEITDKTKEEFGLPIVAIIDEEHMFWSQTADKSSIVLDKINPMVEIRISATPKTSNPKEKVTVYRQDVIAAEMIKKEVVLNPDIELNFSDALELNANLIKVALDKRNQIAEAYKAVGENINPLLLIQLPNDTKENMTDDDTAIAEQVKQYLDAMCGINTDNHRLAIWLSREKENLTDLEKHDNMTEVLLFKEAIALGWDCPRAAVLLIFRKLKSDRFTIQTVGRIMRMPKQKHYQKEILNSGYVFTDIAKDKIEIVTADAGYILKNTITAHRRESLKNVNLPSFYSERPNVERNVLGSDFRRVLREEARKFWNFEQGKLLFSLEELAKLDSTDDDFSPLPENDDIQINENRKKVANSIRLDVKKVNREIPQDVHFQNEEQVLEVSTLKYARKANEIDKAFINYIATKGHQFESKERTTKIANYLLEIIADFFGIFDTDAKKVVLYHSNRPKFDHIIDSALDRYFLIRENARKESAAKRMFKQYSWEVPEERTYDSETNHIEKVGNHALLPFVQLNQASGVEKEFIAYLEQNNQYIDWWYKNGDKGKQHYAIEYSPEGSNSKSLFYVDFVIRMKNGHIYLFDTKSKGSDIFASDKHNALLKYIKENTTKEQPLNGGVILRNGENWLFSSLPIENTIDTQNWSCFYPQNA